MVFVIIIYSRQSNEKGKPVIVMNSSKKLTVVVPVYNAEQFLEATIESIIAQDIGFREHIILCLIDDGSTDQSGAICKTYAREYPDDIRYVRKENGGASSARNLGLSMAETRFVTFCDADDYWSAESFSRIIDFFEQHYEEIDLVASRIRIFGDTDYDHPLNFRFTGNKIIDLKVEPYAIQTTLGNVVYKTDAVKNFFFDEKNSLLEDVLLNTKLLLEKKKYGIVSDSCYYYRKQYQTSSLSNTVQHNRHWYLGVPEDVFIPILNDYRGIDGRADQYAQSVVAYFIRWRIPPTGIQETLTEQERAEYTARIRQLLQELDDDVIASVHGISVIHRNFLFYLKYDQDIFTAADLENGVFRFHGHNIFNARGRGLARIVDVSSSLRGIVITGTTNTGIAGNHCALHAETANGNELKVVVADDPAYDVYAFTGECIRRGKSFKLVLPHKCKGRFKFYTTIDAQKEKYYCVPTFDAGITGSFDRKSKETVVKP